MWNPWAEKAKAMSDFDDDGFKSMVCVEPGHVDTRVTLKPGEEWTGSQLGCPLFCFNRFEVDTFGHAKILTLCGQTENLEK